MLYDQISITLTPQAIEQIDQLVKLIEHEWNNYDNYSNTIIQGLVIQFFVTALRGQTFSSQNDVILKETHFSLINAIHYVQCHYVEDPSLRETAEAVHLSDSYLSRLFTSRLDTTYSRFLTGIKILMPWHYLLIQICPLWRLPVNAVMTTAIIFLIHLKKLLVFLR